MGQSGVEWGRSGLVGSSIGSHGGGNVNEASKWRSVMFLLQRAMATIAAGCCGKRCSAAGTLASTLASEPCAGLLVELALVRADERLDERRPLLEPPDHTLLKD